MEWILKWFADEAQPLLRRTISALDDVQDVAARVRRAEASARAAADRMTGTWRTAKAVVQSRLWPILGAARAIQAIAGAIAARRSRLDRDAEQRFTYEGGPYARE